MEFQPISIKVLKPDEFKSDGDQIQVSVLRNYLLSGVAWLVDGHHRLAVADGDWTIKFRRQG